MILTNTGTNVAEINIFAIIMEFRTQVNPRPSRQKIDYSMNGLSIGSCFAESMAAMLLRAKFHIVSNPFGVLFNPASIADSINMLNSGRVFTMNDLVREGDIWSCFSFHGSFSSTDPGKALEKMNMAVRLGGEALRKADYVILTFGTAWVYELNPDYGAKDEGNDENLYERAKRLVREIAKPKVVANCHKFPAKTFNRRRLSVSEIVDICTLLLRTLLADKHVIITVSPVRHVKDGLEENSISKATLLLAASELAAAFENVDYFPSYEIVNDELRDYRFYKEDMVHPSDQTVKYIWELFAGTFFSKKTVEMVEEIEKIVTASEHRPLNPDSAVHRRFLRSMMKKAEALQKKHPIIDLSQEISYFGS